MRLGGAVHSRRSLPSDAVTYAGFRETPVAAVLGTVFGAHRPSRAEMERSQVRTEKHSFNSPLRMLKPYSSTSFN